MPQETRSWRASPFAVGRSYRVRRDFKALRDTFAAGEVLVYESDAYSHYHGYTAYVFSQSGREQKRVWDIHDDDTVESWRELFDEVE